MDDSIPLQDVKRLRLNPGDVLVVHMDTGSAEILQHVQASLEGVFPDNRVLIASTDVELEVVESAHAA